MSRRARQTGAAATDAELEPAPFTGAPGSRASRCSRRGRSSAPRRRRSASGSGSATAPGAASSRSRSRSLITIEPVEALLRRRPSRERLVELFGEPERWASTTDELPLGAGRRARARLRRARPSSSSPSPAPTTSSSPRRSTSTGSPTARRRCASTSTARVFYEAEDGRLQIVQLPWDRSAALRMPVEAWRRMIDAHYPYRGWVRCTRRRSTRLSGARRERGAADLRRGGRRAARRSRGRA